MKHSGDKADEQPVSDGRRLRSERSKLAVMEACERLTVKGILVPTAQEVSDEAGVPIRTFFRHFPDMESLFRDLDDHLSKKYANFLFQSDYSGSLEDRIKNMVAKRAENYEQGWAIFKSTRVQLWRYDILRSNYKRLQSNMKKDEELWLPELLTSKKDVSEIVHGIISFEMWTRLREHQGLSVASCKKHLSEAITKLML